MELLVGFNDEDRNEIFGRAISSHEIDCLIGQRRGARWKAKNMPEDAGLNCRTGPCQGVVIPGRACFLCVVAVN